LQLDVQFAELLGFHERGGIGHEIGALGGLGKGDHVTDAGGTAEDGVEAIEAEGDATVRRRAVTEGFQHVPKARLNHLRRNLQYLFKNCFLHLGLMNTYRSATQFDAVHDHVVVLAAHLLGIAEQQRDVLGHRCGERMMAGVPAVLFLVEAEEREIHDPEEFELVGGNAELPLLLQHVGAVEANLAKNLAGGQPLVGGEENEIALLDGQLLCQSGFLRVVEEFDDGRFPFAVFDLDVGEAFRAETLGVFGHVLDLALRGAGEALGVDRLYHAAVRDGAAEDLEGAGPEFLREIGELHAEAEVGLVDTETIERLVEGGPAERRGNVHVKRRLPDAFQQAFDQSVNVLAFDERHLDVHLGELELAIGALVFVAIAAGELEIFFHAADHEDLLELLRG